MKKLGQELRIRNFELTTQYQKTYSKVFWIDHKLTKIASSKPFECLFPPFSALNVSYDVF